MQKQRDNAEAIAAAGKNLYQRLVKFAKILDEAGTLFDRATRKFNDAVGSFTGRLIPAGRDIAGMLGVADVLRDVDTVGSFPRPVTLAAVDVASGTIEVDNGEEGQYRARVLEA